jgi:hypothetical protein
MTDRPSNDGYEIGYGRPPQHSRFNPGVSGNPTGKRKGTRNLSSDVKRALLVPVKLNDHGKSRNVSTQEAALMRLREKALKGDSRSLDRLLELARLFNNDAANSAPRSSSEDEKILAAYDREVLARGSASSACSSITGCSNGASRKPRASFSSSCSKTATRTLR